MLDINKPTKDGFTPLHLVYLNIKDNNKQEEIANILLNRQDIDVNFKSNRGITPLHLASLLHSDQISNWLLEKDAKVDATTDSGKTPLMCACKVKNNVKNVQLLLEKQANVSIRETNSGWQAIHFASHAGNSDVIDLLLGADVNSKTPIFKGRVTPIILALKYGHNNLAEHLLSDKRADLDVRGTDDVVGCFNNAKNDQSGIFSTIACTLFCGWAVPFFVCCPIGDDTIKNIIYENSHAAKTMFPCLHPTAESFITDSGLLARVASIKDRAITEEPKSTLQSLKNKLTNSLYSYMPLLEED